jgi:PhzF family phenazine biosynthesis protein
MPGGATEVLRYAAFTTIDGRGGNPAGVVLDARELDENDMLHTAAWLNYSETAFVTEPLDRQGRARVRYFAPLQEVPFCGHATIATAVALAERGAPADLQFETRAGPVRVHTESSPDGVSAELTSVPPRVIDADERVVGEALGALRWAAEDLDPGYPPAVADAGARHLVLVTRTRERLADLDYDFDRLAALMRAEHLITLQLVWPESASRYHSRNPFAGSGVVEDPATGAAAAALGGYLRNYQLAPPTHEFTVSQGVDMGSPSELLVRMDSGEPGVRVRGYAAPISD